MNNPINNSFIAQRYGNIQPQRQPGAHREKRRISKEEVELCRIHAKRGHSLTSSSRLLGLYPQQLAALLEAAKIVDIPFAKGRQSIASRAALAALHDSRRGASQPNQRPEVYKALARGRETTRKKHMRSAFGVTGTVKDLMENFSCELTRNGVYQRLRRGMSIEEALTKEPMATRSTTGTTSSPQLTMGQEEIIKRAKEYAKRGHSFSFTAQLLGMTNKRLRRLLDEEDADIEFVLGTKSLAFRKRLDDLHESQRGKNCHTNLSPESLAAMARGREKGREARGCKRYTAFGVTGYLSELKEHFNCPIQAESIRARIASGMSVEDALTTPVRKQKKGVYPPQFYDWLIKRRTMAAADILMIARKRLTPTMLQYREPEHDIRITARDGASITVEVRTMEGYVLHRLRFLKTFDSGVLFVFKPEINGRLQFIAFEPDYEALQKTMRPAT